MTNRVNSIALLLPAVVSACVLAAEPIRAQISDPDFEATLARFKLQAAANQLDPDGLEVLTTDIELRYDLGVGASGNLIGADAFGGDIVDVESGDLRGLDLDMPINDLEDRIFTTDSDELGGYVPVDNVEAGGTIIYRERPKSTALHPTYISTQLKGGVTAPPRQVVSFEASHSQSFTLQPTAQPNPGNDPVTIQVQIDAILDYELIEPEGATTSFFTGFFFDRAGVNAQERSEFYRFNTAGPPTRVQQLFEDVEASFEDGILTWNGTDTRIKELELAPGEELNFETNLILKILNASFTESAQMDVFNTAQYEVTLLTEGYELVAVPEPSSIALLGLGGLLVARRRR